MVVFVRASSGVVEQQARKGPCQSKGCLTCNFSGSRGSSAKWFDCGGSVGVGALGGSSRRGGDWLRGWLGSTVAPER